MVKRISFLFLLLSAVLACSPDKYTSLEDQLKELETMKIQASEIKASLKDKKGKEFLKEHDRYYDILLKRTKKAIHYLNKADAQSLTSINDLRTLVKIAEITHNEQKIVDILKIIFNRFPETKMDKRLLKVYFPNAYLLEPEEIEKYVDLSIFSYNEQLECYYALALGFSELENPEKAEEYNKKGNDLLQQLISEGIQRNTIPVLRLAGLRSFIEYKLGNTSEGYKIINDAKKELTDDYSGKQLELLENRLKILGQQAKSIEYQFYIGTKQPVDLSALQGNVILLNFFTWNCEPCNLYLPFLFALEEQINSSNFKIVGVTQYTGSYESYQNISELQEYKYLKDHYYKKRKLTWPVNITRSEWMDDYGISTFPIYILIDKDGIVRDGYFISNYSYLKKKIELLLKH
ncbi:MAG: TlpA family protein disulfide reductase [Spirochaetales bacterium]|nr:TlpA family protein disulfide reductase [Spirochaetales bacterium]